MQAGSIGSCHMSEARSSRQAASLVNAERWTIDLHIYIHQEYE